MLCLCLSDLTSNYLFSVSDQYSVAVNNQPQPQPAEGSNKTESGESSKDVSTGTVVCPPSSSGELPAKSEDLSGSVMSSSEENAKPVPLGLGLGGLERKV